LRHRFGEKAWNTWPVDYKHRNTAALKKVHQDEQEQISRIKFYQYIFFEQWFTLKKYCTDNGISVIGDVPIYVSYDSMDVWSNPHIFKLDENREPYAVSGVPPDYFSATGQLWNTPVYNWDVLKETGYTWWIQRMRCTLERFDIVRIDHFRGLVQYWEVPAGEETAMNGAWIDVPVYEFFDTMEKAFSPFPIIAEDLGIITDDVREVMAHYSYPGMKVLQFAFGEDNPDNPYLPHNYERNCIVYTGTHDNNTTRGWLEEDASDEDKQRFYRYIGRETDVIESLWDYIRLAQSSVADVAIIPLQDILQLDGSARMNLPSRSFGNWQWRFTQDDFSRIPVQRIAEMSRRYGRC
jgi:4-alpha-glucanotransferase